MAFIYVRHRVNDFNQWKTAFDGDEANRKAAGITGHYIQRDPDDANLIIVAMPIASMAAAKAMASSEELHQTMMKAGVEGQPRPGRPGGAPRHPLQRARHLHRRGRDRPTRDGHVDRPGRGRGVGAEHHEEGRDRGHGLGEQASSRCGCAHGGSHPGVH